MDSRWSNLTKLVSACLTWLKVLGMIWSFQIITQFFTIWQHRQTKASSSARKRKKSIIRNIGIVQPLQRLARPRREKRATRRTNISIAEGRIVPENLLVAVQQVCALYAPPDPSTEARLASNPLIFSAWTSPIIRLWIALTSHQKCEERAPRSIVIESIEKRIKMVTSSTSKPLHLRSWKECTSSSRLRIR